MDGVEITDMAATGASPTYFNFDNFEEIQVSTAGNDIKSRTGGMGLNMVVKRGTNSFSGSVPRLLRQRGDGVRQRARRARSATGVTHETSDHNKQISDYGCDARRPDHPRQGVVLRLVFDPGRAAGSPRRRAGRSHAAEEPEREGELAGDQEGQHQLPVSRRLQDQGRPQPRRHAASCSTRRRRRIHQDNAYEDTPFHGLWKIADDHTFGTNLFVSANYAYYNTGFVLDPIGGLDQQAGRNFVTAQSYGSVNQGLNVRPQHSRQRRRAVVPERAWARSHEVKFGVGWRTTDAISRHDLAGQHAFSPIERANNLQAQVFRQGSGGNRANYLNFYVGDTIAHEPL